MHQHDFLKPNSILQGWIKTSDHVRSGFGQFLHSTLKSSQNKQTYFQDDLGRESGGEGGQFMAQLWAKFGGGVVGGAGRGGNL